MVQVLAGLMVVPFAIGFAIATDGPKPDVEFSFSDPEIVEASGLVAGSRYFVTVNDSGDTGRIFVVDPATGDTVGQAGWGEASDVEAVAPMPNGDVLVGDIGDNGADRKDVEILEVPVGVGETDVDPVEYSLRYPGGPRDAETLMVHPKTGQIFVISKAVFGGTLYAAPKDLDPDQANELDELGPVLGLATDGSFFPDGRHFIVRDYGSAAIYSYPDVQEVADFELPAQRQGEAISVAKDGSVFVTSEGQNADVLRVKLPKAAKQALAPPSPPAEPEKTQGADPANEAGSEGKAADAAEDDGLSVPWLVGGLVALMALIGAGVGARRRR